MFSLGCLLFFTLTFGGHPFLCVKKCDDKGWGDLNNNISDGNEGLDILFLLKQVQELGFNLIRPLIDEERKNRPPIEAVICHPLFWKEEKVTRFLTEVSENGTDLKDELDMNGVQVLSKSDWSQVLDEPVLQSLIDPRGRPYNRQKISDLIRFIRNKQAHFQQDLPTIMGLVDHFGETKESVLSYFLLKFPLLLVHTFVVYQQKKDCPNFEQFYKKTDPDRPDLCFDTSEAHEWRHCY
jgi:serine/threonine protein kinase